VAAVLSLLVSEVVAFVNRRQPRVEGAEPTDPTDPTDPTERPERPERPERTWRTGRTGRTEKAQKPSKAPRQVPTHETDYVGWINELQTTAGDPSDLPAPTKSKSKGSGRHSRGDTTSTDATGSIKPITQGADPSIYPAPSSSATAGKPSDGPMGQPRN
jgi:hypothetical protein